MSDLPAFLSKLLNESPAHLFEATLPNVDPIIQVSMFTMVALQVILHLSCHGCHFLLSMIQYIIQLSMTYNKHSISPYNEEFVANIPTDQASIQKVALDGREMIYAVCPNAKCHKMY